MAYGFDYASEFHRKMNTGVLDGQAKLYSVSVSVHGRYLRVNRKII